MISWSFLKKRAIITDLHQICPRISNAIQCVICNKKSEPRDKASQCMLLRASSGHQCVLPDRHKGSPSSQSLFSTTTDHRRHCHPSNCHPSKWKYPLLCQNMKDLISALPSISSLLVVIIILPIVVKTRDANLVDIQECATMPRLAALSYLPAWQTPQP